MSTTGDATVVGSAPGCCRFERLRNNINSFAVPRAYVTMPGEDTPTAWTKQHQGDASKSTCPNRPWFICVTCIDAYCLIADGCLHHGGGVYSVWQQAKLEGV